MVLTTIYCYREVQELQSRMAAHAQVAQSPLYQAAQQQAADLREQLAAKQRDCLDLDLKLADAQHRMHIQDRQAWPLPINPLYGYTFVYAVNSRSTVHTREALQAQGGSALSAALQTGDLRFHSTRSHITCADSTPCIRSTAMHPDASWCRVRFLQSQFANLG